MPSSTPQGGIAEGWEPEELVEHDSVTARSVGALRDLLDDGSFSGGGGSESIPAGEEVPALWHWLAFLPHAPQHALDADGHPRRGGFLPPISLPRRMFVGSRVELGRAPGVDVPLVRRGRVESVEEKQGRSGRLVFVRVRFAIALADDEDVSVVTEEQDIVYRDAVTGPPLARSTASAVPPETAPASSDRSWTWRWDLPITPSLLFRFSALTYNAHRIHYDREWATSVEGYPGLVVHGPLQAIALAELCARNAPRRTVTSLAFRAVSPKFDDGPLLLRGREESERRVRLVAFDHLGAVTMRGCVTLRPS